MDLAAFERLLTPAGADALDAATTLAPTEPTFLRAFDALRKRFPAELAKAAVETAILRTKARAKFADADRMFFTREALEQASSEAVARHRAARFARFGTVLDLCCGIGADTLALATVTTVIGIDADPLRARMAAANLAACGVGGVSPFAPRKAAPFAERKATLGDTIRGGHIVTADIFADPLPAADAAFCDPGRRVDGKRYVRPADYQPPPAAVLARLPADMPVAFKLAPGVPTNDLDEFDGEIEFVSLGGELKECVLWLREFTTTRRRATVLPAGVSLVGDDVPDVPAGSPLRYVYDADPAVVRAGLTDRLAADLGGRLLDVSAGIVSTDALHDTPFATRYAVEAVTPADPRRLSELLRECGVGRVTVVKSGSPVNADGFAGRLKGRGDAHRFVLLTRVEGRAVAIVARREETPPAKPAGGG